MQLKYLIQNLPGAVTNGPVEREIAALAYDSRKVKPGALFAALRGEKVDGLVFLDRVPDTRDLATEQEYRRIVSESVASAGG